jgi:hypothetical protein
MLRGLTSPPATLNETYSPAISSTHDVSKSEYMLFRVDLRLEGGNCCWLRSVIEFKARTLLLVCDWRYHVIQSAGSMYILSLGTVIYPNPGSSPK